ncbi:MAG: helix-turn-helix transcriptional regulator [Spirochaetia bacterium]
MLHAILAAYILCFAGGVTLVVVSFFASRRFSLAGFRDFALLFSASTLIMIAEASKTYERAVAIDFGDGLHVAGVVLTVLGNIGLAWYLLTLALQAVNIAPSRARNLGRGALAVAIGLPGGLKEAAPLLWSEAGPGIVLWNVNYVALLVIHVFAAGILLSGLKRIENQWLKSFVRTFLVLLGVFVPLAVVQLVVQDIPTSPGYLRDYPLEQLTYYLVVVIIALIYILRYFVQPSRSSGINLPEDFIRRFGISHRESEIIDLMAKGFSNGGIAEKLFISTLTVKNHVYHIYQKTGAENKVQLLNMMNSSK